MASHTWSDITVALSQAIPNVETLMAQDAYFKAFTSSNAIDRPVAFRIKSSGLTNTPSKIDKTTLAGLKSRCSGRAGSVNSACSGDPTSFSQWTHVWRRTLELVHDAICGPIGERLKAETGEAFSMGYDRSFPSRTYHHEAHTNTEETYIGWITSFVKNLGFNTLVICGASMADQICLEVAIRYKEFGAGGSIHLQGGDHLDMQRQWYDRSQYVNQSLFNPAWIYGMMSPTAPYSYVVTIYT